MNGGEVHTVRQSAFPVALKGDWWQRGASKISTHLPWPVKKMEDVKPKYEFYDEDLEREEAERRVFWALGDAPLGQRPGARRAALAHAGALLRAALGAGGVGRFRAAAGAAAGGAAAAGTRPPTLVGVDARRLHALFAPEMACYKRWKELRKRATDDDSAAAAAAAAADATPAVGGEGEGGAEGGEGEGGGPPEPPALVPQRSTDRLEFAARRTERMDRQTYLDFTKARETMLQPRQDQEWFGIFVEVGKKEMEPLVYLVYDRIGLVIEQCIRQRKSGQLIEIVSEKEGAITEEEVEGAVQSLGPCVDDLVSERLKKYQKELQKSAGGRKKKKLPRNTTIQPAHNGKVRPSVRADKEDRLDKRVKGLVEKEMRQSQKEAQKNATTNNSVKRDKRKNIKNSPMEELADDRPEKHSCTARQESPVSCSRRKKGRARPEMGHVKPLRMDDGGNNSSVIKRVDMSQDQTTLGGENKTRMIEESGVDQQWNEISEDFEIVESVENFLAHPLLRKGQQLIFKWDIGWQRGSVVCKSAPKKGKAAAKAGNNRKGRPKPSRGVTTTKDNGAPPPQQQPPAAAAAAAAAQKYWVRFVGERGAAHELALGAGNYHRDGRHGAAAAAAGAWALLGGRQKKEAAKKKKGGKR